MLVLAMEFSRGAERTQGAGPPNFQTGGSGAFRAGERPADSRSHRRRS